MFLNPLLPEDCLSLRLRVRYRGHNLLLTMDHKKLKVENLSMQAGEVEVALPERTYRVIAGESFTHGLTASET